MTSFDARPSPRIVFGAGRLAELPECVATLGVSKLLLVTDPGIVAAGHVGRATGYLEAAGLSVTVFQGTHVNPSESDIEACRSFATELQPDAIIGLGGGSSMDTAKGCNFLLHNPGRMSDYRGYGLAKNAMLPFIAIPTTAGTGSECQSYAVVSRDGSHEKMACGDPKALAKIAILDPELTVSQPQPVATLTALDALSHALESAVCTKRNPISSAYSAEAFRLIASAIRPVLAGSAGPDTRGRMLLGAAMAGSAIENSMLGAAHATANPLTARFDVAHGHAVSLMLPHVVRLNSADPAAAAIYDGLARTLGEPLLPWLEETIALAGLDTPVIDPATIPDLAADAARQWTGRFNPVPLRDPEITSLYHSSFAAAAAP
ncbi:iron-containing alcohol dehydrogenase [Luteolibacter marinus]|uniref:iron-containing alcohol dehydrogenase n=1 Tax=Luteolibacter marinus TaxID=2776705 RepID=UPI0018670F55|nr:iron-containing alcohol dehydrogenase [Luteolibacter marinus]